MAKNVSPFMAASAKFGQKHGQISIFLAGTKFILVNYLFSAIYSTIYARVLILCSKTSKNA